MRLRVTLLVVSHLLPTLAVLILAFPQLQSIVANSPCSLPVQPRAEQDCQQFESPTRQLQVLTWHGMPAKMVLSSTQLALVLGHPLNGVWSVLRPNLPLSPLQVCDAPQHPEHEVPE